MKTNLPQTGAGPGQKAMLLIRRIIHEFIYHEKDLTLRSELLGRSFKIIIQAHRADTPRIVGERGAHIKALSALAEAVGEKEGCLVILELLEPRTGEIERYATFKPLENWREDYFKKLLEDIARAVFRSDLSVEINSSGETTVMEVVLNQKQEQLQRIETLGGALKTLFNAIGKANGRRIYVSVLPAPVTAA